MVAVALGWLVLHESVTTRTVAAMVLILGAVLWIQVASRAVSHNTGEIGDPLWPVQRVKIEIISAETGEARLASARDAVSRHVSGPHLGDQEYAVALTGNCSAD